MKSGKLNARILQVIKEKSKEDNRMSAFLIDLIYKEAESSLKWRWKEHYKRMLDKYLK